MKQPYFLCKLSKKFYADYDEVNYPEIEHKESRPYIVFVVMIDGVQFALPLRTNIKHNFAYKFKNTTRDTHSSTGIDYTKAIVVRDSKYIGVATTIDNKEYVELNDRYYFIIKQFTNYLAGFKKAVKNQSTGRAFAKYQYSTLNYFKTELGL